MLVEEGLARIAIVNEAQDANYAMLDAMSKQIAELAKQASIKHETVDVDTETIAGTDTASQTTAATGLALDAEATDSPAALPKDAGISTDTGTEKKSPKPKGYSKGVHTLYKGAAAQVDKDADSKHPWGEKFQTLDKEPEDFYYNGDRVRVERKDSYEHPESLALETLLTVYLGAKAKGVESPFVSANPNGDPKLVALFYGFAEVLKESGLNISFETPSSVDTSNAKNMIYNYLAIDSSNDDQAKAAGDKLRRIYLAGNGAQEEVASYVEKSLGWDNINDVLVDYDSETETVSEESSRVIKYGLYYTGHNPAGDDQIPEALKDRGAGVNFGEVVQQQLIELFSVILSEEDSYDALNSYRANRSSISRP